MKRQIALQLNGQRKFREEFRTDGFESLQNKRLVIPYAFGDYTEFKDIVERSTATGATAVYSDLGDTAQHDASNVEVESVAHNQVWQFTKNTVEFHITNTSTHPVHLKLIEVVAASSFPFDSSGSILDTSTQCVYDAYESILKHGLTAGTATLTLKEGAQAVTLTGGQLSIFSKFDQVGVGSYFREHWKVLKR